MNIESKRETFLNGKVNSSINLYKKLATSNIMLTKSFCPKIELLQKLFTLIFKALRLRLNMFKSKRKNRLRHFLLNNWFQIKFLIQFFSHISFPTETVQAAHTKTF